MASQSALRARVATIRELLAPDTSRLPCFTVRINRESPASPAPLLLTAGEEPATEAQSPAAPGEASKRSDGHLCGPRCLEIAINFKVRPSADAVGAHSGSGRGDVQRLPESTAAGRDVEPQSGPPRSAAPAYGPDEGSGEVLIGGRARDAVLDVRASCTHVPLGGPTPQLGPEDVVGGPEPHGRCAIPWCHHPLQAHRCFTDTLPCRYCGWPVTAHEGFDPVLGFGLAFSARRAMACGTYLAIRFDGGEWDGCSVEGCGCPGWRLKPPYISEYDARIQALLDEKDRIIARNEETLARLQAEMEAAERELLRATSVPNDLGAAPHGCPVYSDEVSR